MVIPFYFYFNLLAVFIWLLVRSRFKEPLLDKIGILISASLVIESLALIYAYTLETSNHWIYFVFTTVQIIFIALIYASLITDKHIARLINIFTFAFLILVILNLTLLQDFFKFHTYSYIAGCFLIFYISIRYFKQLLNEKNWQPLKKLPFFWITIGNIVYFICSMFYMGSINYINEKDFDVYGSLINIFVYSFTSAQSILYTIAFLCNLNPKER